jgi:hypothetical protein
MLHGDMLHGDMLHEDIDMQHGPAALTSSMDKQNRHAA